MGKVWTPRQAMTTSYCYAQQYWIEARAWWIKPLSNGDLVETTVFLEDAFISVHAQWLFGHEGTHDRPQLSS